MNEVQVVKEVEIVPRIEIPLEKAAKNLAELNEYIKTQMVKGDDFGVIPGTYKPTLLKPGAEKLENIYGFYHEFVPLDKIEDFDKQFCFYRYKCVIFHKRTGIKQAEAVGSCNSKEKCRQKKDGTWPDFYTLINTIDKMAQKRAFVGAILNACRVSSKFTQDIEDMGLNKPKTASTSGLECVVCHSKISQKVSDFSNERHKRALCMPCQEEEPVM